MALATNQPSSVVSHLLLHFLLFFFFFFFLFFPALVHAQCRQLTRKSLIDQVNDRTLSLTERRTIIRTAQRLLSDINPHGQLHLKRLKVNPLLTLSRAQERLESMTPFQFHRTMISIFSSMDDRNTFYKAPSILSNTRASLGFWLRPYWDSPTSSKRPNFAVAGPDAVLDRVPDDMPKGSRVIQVDGKNPVEFGIGLAKQGYAATYAHRLWDASFLLSSRLFGEHPFPKKDSSVFQFVHPNGTTLSITVSWVFLDCTAPTSPDDDRVDDDDDAGIATRDSSSEVRLRGVEEEMRHREFPGRFDEMGEEEAGRMTTTNRKEEEEKEFVDIGEGNRQGIAPFYNWSFQSFNLGREVSWYLVTIHTELGTLYSIVPFTFNIVLTKSQKGIIHSLLSSLPEDANIALDIRGAGEMLTRQSLQTARYLILLLTGRDLPVTPVHVRASARMREMTRGEGSGEGLLLGEGGKAVRRGLEMEERYAAPFGDLFSGGGRQRPNVEGEDGRVYFGELAMICTTSTTQLFEMLVVWLRDVGISPYVLSINGRTGGNVVSSVSYSELALWYPHVWNDTLADGVDMSTAWNRQFRRGRLAGEEVQYFGIRPDVDYKFSFDDIMGSWEGVERTVLRWFNARKLI